jgi:hypothetical protein
VEQVAQTTANAAAKKDEPQDVRVVNEKAEPVPTDPAHATGDEGLPENLR